MTQRIATAAAILFASATLATAHTGEGPLHFLSQPDHALGLLAAVAALAYFLYRASTRTRI